MPIAADNLRPREGPIVTTDSLDLRALMERLFPIARSITGDGVRETLAVLNEHIAIDVFEVPTGTTVLDWTVPDEWNIREAWIKAPDGSKVVDFADSNLHVVGYSTPIHAEMSLTALQPHLHSLPDRPTFVPFVASYFDEAWGFCLAHEQREDLDDGTYEIYIDSTLASGSLTYGEHVIAGETDREIIVSAHVDHPSLANENVSGLATSVAIAQRMAALGTPHHTIRFIFAPATVGAITWLALNQDRVTRIAGGLTLTSLGDDAPLRYKKTQSADTTIDRVAARVLGEAGVAHEFLDFYPFGYDERQYNSPGFRLPVGSFMRAIHGRTPEYHTSGDNLDLVDDNQIAQAIEVIVEVLAKMDATRSYVNRAPHGEPQLGRRGIYDAVGGKNIPDFQLAMLWVLNQSDGSHDLVSIASVSGLPIETVTAAADVLLEHDLIG